MPLGVRAADLVVSWQKAHHPREDEALAEIIAAFEQDTGKQVEVTLLAMAEQPPQIEAALEANRPPDVAFGFWLSSYIPEWALEDRLVDLTDTVGSFSNMFDPAQLNRAMLLNAKTGQKAL
jgi:ABC-type glycerol-3-phosphate transport system substrate-binding protein